MPQDGVRMITREQYKKALDIHLSIAYEGDDETQILKMAIIDDPDWGAGWANKIPVEARFGCNINPHMIIKIVDKEYFKVIPYTHNAPLSIRRSCRRIKKNIELAWYRAGLPVIPGSMR
jgi:hypothetical protein